MRGSFLNRRGWLNPDHRNPCGHDAGTRSARSRCEPWGDQGGELEIRDPHRTRTFGLGESGLDRQ